MIQIFRSFDSCTTCVIRLLSFYHLPFLLNRRYIDPDLSALGDAPFLTQVIF